MAAETMLRLAMILGAGLMASEGAMAHGANPSTCVGPVAGAISSFVIGSGDEAIEVVGQSDVVIDATIGVGYDVTLTLAANDRDGSSPSEAGHTIWYRSTAYGFGNGVCQKVLVSQNEGVLDTVVALHGVRMGQAGPGMTQTAEWSTMSSQGIKYQVRWHAASAED